MTYAAFIHGATGVIFFGFDSFVMRDGNVMGIAPDPIADYGSTPDFDNSKTPPLRAAGKDLAASRAAWAEAGKLARELSNLAPIILAPTSPRHLGIKVLGERQSPVPVRAILKRQGDAHYLIVVNLDNAPLRVEFEWGARLRQVSAVVGQGSSISLTAAGWRDNIEALGVRVYRIQ